MTKILLVMMIALSLQPAHLFTADHIYATGNLTSNSIQPLNDDAPFCEFTVVNKSKTYFQDQVRWLQPNFITFQLKFDNNTGSVLLRPQPDVFKPYIWFWTYETGHEKYPYLYWNLDFGLLTFGLLDHNTEQIQYVLLEARVKSGAQCMVSVGNNATNINIAQALSEMFDNVKDEDRFENVYFCYMSVNKTANETWEYKAGLYFNYPVPFIEYTCCDMKYDYESQTYQNSTCTYKPKKWTLCTLGPYILGIIIFLYFPIVMFRFFHTLTEDEPIQSYDHELLSELSTSAPLNTWREEQWVFLDEKSPLTLSHLPGILLSGFRRAHPVMFSRLRRLLCLLLIPSFLFARVFLYRKGIGDTITITIGDIVAQGTPIGFLSILGNQTDARQTFVPLFGGPVGMLAIYILIGIFLIVMPRSLKQIVENGMPKKREWSPLFLSVDEILSMAMLKPQTEPGYQRAAAVFTGSILMLFNSCFWHKLFYTQKRRLSYVRSWSKCRYMFVFPFIALLSAIEILVCVVYNLVPVFNFAVISIKGAVLTIVAQRRYYNFAIILFSYPFVWLIVLICSGLFTVFAYTLCLIFFESFVFVSQVTLMCFVAIIVTPTTAFGYLFFVLVLLYYLAKLARGFGDVYFELIAIATEMSLNMEEPVNQIFIQDGHIEIPNISAINIRSIRIKDTLVDIPQNTLQKINTSQVQRKTVQKGNRHGIPKDLFHYLIEKHRPVHIQILKVFFRISLIITLTALAMSITSMFNMTMSSDSSEVMHVIFIVTVGALPHLFEIMMTDGSEVVKRQLEEKDIEQSILRYWRTKSELDFRDSPWK